MYNAPVLTLERSRQPVNHVAGADKSKDPVNEWWAGLLIKLYG
jgi:hypothetical protein